MAPLVSDAGSEGTLLVVGITLLILVIGVVLWRITSSRPANHPGMDPREAATLAVNSGLDATHIDADPRCS